MPWFACSARGPGSPRVWSAQFEGLVMGLQSSAPGVAGAWPSPRRAEGSLKPDLSSALQLGQVRPACRNSVWVSELF